MILHYNGDNSYLFVKGKKKYKLKANNENVKFPNQSWLVSIPNKEAEQLSLNRYHFSVDYDAKHD